MIAFDFDYYLPESVDEAVRIYSELKGQGKKAVYYGGGTELISMARLNNLSFNAAIDIKGIPECRALERDSGRLMIGSAVSLTRIDESKLFPLLGSAVSRIADHTVQGKITLGGNIAGTIIYREAVLPLLLTDCQVVLAGPGGRRQLPIGRVFHERLQLKKDELIVGFLIDASELNLPYFHAKKTKIEKIDYPIVTVAALMKDDQIRISFSGLCDFPFRSNTMESDLNQKNLPLTERINQALSHLRASIRNDLQSAGDYRAFICRNAIFEACEGLGV